MIRHIVIAALRNMAANKLLSAITILGLVIGIAAVLVTGLLIRSMYQQNQFLPGYDRTFIVAMPQPERGDFSTEIDPGIAPLLKANIPDIEYVARAMGQGGSLRHGNVMALEPIIWADPDFFAVLPYPVFAGDAQAAMAQPNGAVVTRALACKYFGRDDVVGQTILLDGVPMTIRAVLQDPLRQADSAHDFYASALSAQSPLAAAANLTPKLSAANSVAYLRLRSGASVDAVQKMAHSTLAPVLAGIPAKDRAAYADAPLLVRIDRMVLSEKLRPGVGADIALFLGLGVLLLFIASVNFVNLMTARAARRGVEVGMRKVCGADRPVLILQFLGEAILIVFFSACIGLAIADWLFSNVALLRDEAGPLDYWRDPAVLAVLLLGVVLLGVAAGAWPALILSSFRPVRVFRGILAEVGRTGLIRNGLVTLQFAILIFFTIAAITMYQQQLFVLSQPSGNDIDRMLTIQDDCRPVFLAELRKLPGVAGVACTASDFLMPSGSAFLVHQGNAVSLDVVHADLDAFALYGIKPLAGSLPSAPAGAAPGIVINQAAARRLGFASNRAALGRTVSDAGELSGRPVLAVVPDFSLTFIERPADPALFVPAALGKGGDIVNVRLTGQQIPETLAAIDRVWTRTGHTGAALRGFVTMPHYGSFTSNAQLFAGCALVAVLLACMGLTGISIATAERRTKEIGIRKAMGADSAALVAMLMLQFSRPVLWASLLGWPVAAWWIHGFLASYVRHVSLQPWVFVAASLAALMIALLTVAGHAIWAARQKPVLALRYE